jgi:hypothetical protein
MFTTGSKLFIGATTLALLSTIAWGVLKGGDVGWTGTIGLISLTIALAFLTGINFFVRDCNVGAMDPSAATASAAAQRRPGASIWPFVAAIGLGLLVVGVVTEPVVFQAGLVVLLAVLVEWMVQAWSERASGDPDYNAKVRKRVLNPLEFPVLGAAIVAVIIYSFSRIMLFLSKANGPIVFGVIASLVLFAGFLFSIRTNVKRSLIIGVCTIAGLGLISTGAVMAIDGERDIETHETIENDPAVCLSNEEAEVDHHASQSVAAKSSVAAIVTFENGALSAEVSGIDQPLQTITLPRSNPSNIIFQNLDEEHVRLTANMGTFESTQNGTVVTETPVTCTALVEQGGEQLLTLTFSKSSAASSTPYTLTVPGVQGTSIEIVVP